MAAHNDLGIFGEVYVAEMLRAAGLGGVSLGGPADVIAEGLTVEVKTSRPTSYRGRGSRGFQFLLEKDGHTSIKGDVVVLVCVGPRGGLVCYVIPAEAIGSRRKIGVPLNVQEYGGLWAPYLEAWDVIEERLVI